MTTVPARCPRRAFVAALLSALTAATAIGATTPSAEARGSRSYYRPSRGGTHAHYSCEYGCLGRSRGTRIFGHRTSGFGDEHLGAVGRRFRHGPDGVLYPLAAGADAGEGVSVEAAAPARIACVHDRVPTPPFGYTYFSRPLRPFEAVGQPVAFADEVPDGRKGFTLCE